MTMNLMIIIFLKDYELKISAFKEPLGVTDWLLKLDSLFHISPKDETTKKKWNGIAGNIVFLYVIMLSKNVAKCWFVLYTG
jgi:phytoene dehydrogenase-like protein